MFCGEDVFVVRQDGDPARHAGPASAKGFHPGNLQGTNRCLPLLGTERARTAASVSRQIQEQIVRQGGP